MISAHWETPVPTVNVAARPPLLFDYYGFPEHTYRLTYPAKGAPALAERLQPVFRTRFRRWARLLVLGDGTRIELALDQGRIEAGASEAPICELELELKSGRPEALFELALALQQDLDLRPEPRSKAERGYRG